MRFVACASCRRHVKESDAACPFCGAVAPSFAPRPLPSRVRTTRAAMIAAGTAGSVAALLDCGQGATVQAFYGVPCTGDECLPNVVDSGPDSGTDANLGGVVFYGVVCTGSECFDAQVEAGPADAGQDATPDAEPAETSTDAGGEEG
jgi:hypothetical protein